MENMRNEEEEDEEESYGRHHYHHHPYPAPLATYQDVVSSSHLFMSTLHNLHATMSTKFMIPIIGGSELDLHRLFVEVTSRGGLHKTIQQRRWKEVTATFNFPSTATNASFVLRKYYLSLLHHYEQIYFFQAKGWTPTSTSTSYDSLPSTAPILAKERVDASVLPGASPELSSGSPIVGIIDGKFETGYLITITLGSEKLKGVLYQTPGDSNLQPTNSNLPSSSNENKPASLRLQRRWHRKKSEMKRRDPAHPKPNRSGYNFFFKEQHARLKLIHTGKDRQISRMIGELWNNLKENDRDAYKEKAMEDKERYRREMEDYRERLRTDEIQKGVPGIDSTMLEMQERGEGEHLQTTESDMEN